MLLTRKYPLQKLICFLLCVYIFCIIAGCNALNAPSESNTDDTFMDRSIFEEGNNYRLYTNYFEDYITYTFEVYDNEGDIILSEECDRSVQVRQINDEIVEIDVHTGSGFSQIRYCDIYNKKVSQVFDIRHPFLVVERIIIYDSESEQNLTLVAEDIFEPDRFYKEFVIEGEIHITLTGLKAIGSDKIEVQYAEIMKEGDSYKEDEKVTIMYLTE